MVPGTVFTSYVYAGIEKTRITLIIFTRLIKANTTKTFGKEPLLRHVPRTAINKPGSTLMGDQLNKSWGVDNDNKKIVYKDSAATAFFKRTKGVIAMGAGFTVTLNDGKVLW